MSQVLEVLGRGLLSSLSAGFQAALHEKEPDTTVQELRDRVRPAQQDPEPWVALGQRFLHQFRMAQARDCFAQAVKLDDELAHAKLGLACALDELGRTEEAIEQLISVQQQHPDDPAVCFCLGYCYERCGYVGRAVRHYHNSLKLCPSLRNARERMAAIWLAFGKIDKSIEQYERLCELDPDKIELHLMLANLLLHAGLADRAVDRYELALLIEPDTWGGRNDLAASYEQDGMLPEAIAELRDLLRQEPNKADTYLRLGDLHAKLGQDEAALEQYLQAVQVNPDYLEATVKVGAVHLRANRHLDAAGWFNRAVQANDRLLTAYVGLAVAQRAAGQSKQATSTVEMARSLEPNSTLLFSEMAVLQLQVTGSDTQQHQTGQNGPEQYKPGSPAAEALLDKQIERHQRALRRSPNHADLHYRLGILLRQRGRLDEAIQSYRQAVVINPVYSQALMKMGLALQERGLQDEAVQTLRRALQVKQEDIELHYRLGLLFCQRAQFELTVEQFQHKMRDQGLNVEVHANLALALQNMGLIDEAAATWRGVCELCGDQAAEPVVN